MQGKAGCAVSIKDVSDDRTHAGRKLPAHISEEDYRAARFEITSTIMHDSVPVHDNHAQVASDSSVAHAGVTQTGDSSIRCRVSEICDGPKNMCYLGSDQLGCITDVDQRRRHVVDSIRWAWESYRRCAWGYDEVQPISCRGHQWFGLGLYMIDGLDTLILAGLEQVMTVPNLAISHLSLHHATERLAAGSFVASDLISRTACSCCIYIQVGTSCARPAGGGGGGAVD